MLQVSIVLYKHRREWIFYLEALAIQINPGIIRVSGCEGADAEILGAQTASLKAKEEKKLRNELKP